MRIRFLSDQIYDQTGPGKGPHFPKGFVLDESGVQAALGLKEPPFPEWAKAFLSRWIQRKVAEEVDGRTPVTSPDGDAASAAGKDNQDGPPLELETLTRDELNAIAEGRGIDVSAAKSKADVIAILADLPADLESMTRPDLDHLAMLRGVDISWAKNKGDVIKALHRSAGRP